MGLEAKPPGESRELPALRRFRLAPVVDDAAHDHRGGALCPLRDVARGSASLTVSLSVRLRPMGRSGCGHAQGDGTGKEADLDSNR